MPYYTSEKLAFINAENLLKAFSNSSDGLSSVGYVFIGKSSPYANDSVADSISESVNTEREVWDNMIGAKKITGENLQLVIPKYSYANNKHYRQYDDMIQITELLSENVSQQLKPMYVMNSNGYVYKCISNNNGGISNTEPTGDYTQNANGNIILATDGYIWKYLYRVPVNNQFTTNTWIPVPATSKSLGYNTSNTVNIDGEINTIQVMNVGSGYVDSVIKLEPFGSANSILTVNTSTFSASNLAVGMGISGNGIVGDVFISKIDVAQSKIVISSSTVSHGGGSSNNYNVFTRVVVQGDGTGVETSDTVRTDVILDGNTVSEILVTEEGKNYSWSNVVIYGSGSGAQARAIIAPKYGHGYNPAKELGAQNVMISVKIGEIESTEMNLVADYITFRQVGLLKDPHLYGNTSSINYNSANSFISQTYDIKLGAGPSYALNETVFQGPSETNFIFKGTVNSFINETLKLTNVRGTVSNTALLKSASVPNGRQISEWSTPKFEPYAGEILYVENQLPISREDGQFENIKLIIKY